MPRPSDSAAKGAVLRRDGRVDGRNEEVFDIIGYLGIATELARPIEPRQVRAPGEEDGRFRDVLLVAA